MIPRLATLLFVLIITNGTVSLLAGTLAAVETRIELLEKRVNELDGKTIILPR